MLSLPLVAGIVILLPLVTAECCRPASWNRCKDGTLITPCCGRGGCNFFCCNCDGGCRGGGKRDFVPELTERSESIAAAFAEVDVDGAGNITLDRYLRYMEVGEDSGAWVKWFKE